MDYKDYLDEIKNLLWSTWETTEIKNEDFNSLKGKLLQLYEQTKDSECFAIISELYIHRINSSKRKARFYALKSIENDISDNFSHDNLSIASNSVSMDFVKKNHNELIEFYYDFNKTHPKVFIGKAILVENLIDNYRFDEALKELEDGLKIENEKNYLLEIYKGEIFYKKGFLDEAFEIWSECCRKYDGIYKCYIAIGNELANFAKYDEAIEYFKKGFSMQEKPRKIDALVAIIQIYEIKKNFEEALKYSNLILEIFREDYKVVDEDEIKSYIEYKEKFEKVLKK